MQILRSFLETAALVGFITIAALAADPQPLMQALSSARRGDYTQYVRLEADAPRRGTDELVAFLEALDERDMPLRPLIVSLVQDPRPEVSDAAVLAWVRIRGGESFPVLKAVLRARPYIARRRLGLLAQLAPGSAAEHHEARFMEKQCAKACGTDKLGIHWYVDWERSTLMEPPTVFHTCSGSPAEAAGFRNGDMVLEPDLTELGRTAADGGDVRVDRDGKLVTLRFKSMMWKECESPKDASTLMRR
jgi:hypothetical protein